MQNNANTISNSPQFLRLSEEQRSAAMHFRGPALTLAVPGSGKTTLMIHRAHLLIQSYNLNPLQVLSLTFSKAAATDMAERYTQIFNGHKPPVFSTIHAFAFKLLRQEANASQREPHKVLSDSEQLRLLHQLMIHLKLPYENDDDLEMLRNTFSKLAGLDLIASRSLYQGDKRVLPLLDAYTQYKESHNLIDFDDMLIFADQLLEKNDSLCKQLQQRYPFIQMDEAQDTSALQHRFVRRLLTNEQNLFMVADDDQSIYGFRGADPERLLAFQSDFPRGTVYQLTVNYRSAPEIVEACKQLISVNTSRYPKDFKSHQPPGGLLEHHLFDTLEERNLWLSEAALVDAVILYRNHLSAVCIAHTLNRFNIGFRITDSCRGFFQHWAIRDLCALLDFAIFSNDFETFKKHYYKLNLYISKSTVETLDTHQPNLFAALRQSYSGGWQTKNVDRLEDTLDQIRKTTPIEGLRLILNELGYLQYVSKRTERTTSSAEQVGWLIESLLYIVKDSRTIAEALMTLSDLEQHLKESVGNYGSSLLLSTLHASKGLEFDHVYLVDLNKDILPAPFIESTDGIAAVTEDQHLEEERRLFYVGMSRGRKSIHLLQHKFSAGAYIAPSPFLSEVEKSFKKITKTGSSQPLEPVLNHSYTIGCTLIHEKFGEGTLIDMDGDHWHITFSTGTKKLSAKIMIDNKLIRLP